MSIYEYDEAKVRQADREYGLKEGLKERNRLLVKIICKELEKGEKKESIFEKMAEWEVDSDMVKNITEIAEKFAGEYDWSEVCDKIMEVL